MNLKQDRAAGKLATTARVNGRQRRAAKVPPPPSLVVLLHVTALAAVAPRAWAGDWKLIEAEMITSMNYPAVGASGTSRECRVGPYGWTCTPDEMPAFEDRPAQKPVKTNFQFSVNEECCTPECVDTKFQDGRKLAFKQADEEFYMDRIIGSDKNPGTKALPWKTLRHVHAFIRSRRYTADLAGGTDGYTDGNLVLPTPIQLWIKDEDRVNVGDSYHGILFEE